MIGNKLNQKRAETYSKSFSSKILDNFFQDNQAISGQQILEVTPVKQVNFFILKVLFLQWQEETKKFQSPLFDYSKPEVKNALKGLINTLSKNILIKKEAFKPLLEVAVLDTIQLMYNPSKFYIDEFSSLPHVTRIQGFKGLSKYIKIGKSTYNKIIEKLDNDGKQVITDDEINALVQFVIGQNGISQEEIDQDENAFQSVLTLDVFDEPEPEEEPVMKEEAIEPEGKDSGDILIEIDDKLEDEEIGEIIIEEDNLEEINQDIEDTDQGIIIEEEGFATPAEEENLNEEFSPIVDVKKPQPKQDSPATLNEKFSKEKSTLNEKFETETQKVSIAEVHETEKVSEIQKSISVNQRYMFLSDLFNGDADTYNNALNEVEKSNSFDDSVEILVQKYSKKYDWDMNSDEVKELLKVIFKRFR